MSIDKFWDQARKLLPHLPQEAPEEWSFGATPEHANELLGLVLDGVKTGTASLLGEYESGDELPAAGDLSIILDGVEKPIAIIETTSVTIVPFDEVTEDHAHSEGEGDRTLASWREIHQRFWRTHTDVEFTESSPVVCERFRLIYPVSN
ncbi:MAG: ASCH domain-containing protein [Flaviflexus sp.]|uniref:ASCH domain-containing protein n=1 Tax=Flaviflexus sp. TaxID=1969482 RepID=UPI00352C060A